MAFSGVLFLALFAGGLLAADVLATTSFPEPSRPFGEVVAYFLGNAWPVRILSTCHAFAAVALLAFTAYAGAVLRRPDSDGLRRPDSDGLRRPDSDGLRRPDSDGLRRTDGGALGMVATAGGAVASGMLLLDAALFWALAQPSAAASPPLVEALHDLSYICGGVALALPLGLFIACLSAAGRENRLLPGWLRWAGALAALETALYGATLLGAEGTWSPSGVLVVGAVLPLLWVGAASLVLARSVSRRP